MRQPRALCTRAPSLCVDEFAPTPSQPSDMFLGYVNVRTCIRATTVCSKYQFYQHNNFSFRRRFNYTVRTIKNWQPKIWMNLSRIISFGGRIAIFLLHANWTSSLNALTLFIQNSAFHCSAEADRRTNGQTIWACSRACKLHVDVWM